METAKRIIYTKQGYSFYVWSDFVYRCTCAQNTETGETRVIKSSGYISNERTIQKAIVRAFGLDEVRA